MSLWERKFEGNMFSADESYFWGRYPQQVAKAFIAVGYDDSNPNDEGGEWRPYPDLIEEAIKAFAGRWGGLDDATFVGVLREGVGRDRLAAIFAIGHSALPQAVELLVPLLQSSEQLERCAAACCLGLRRDERAITVLEEYLLHEPPTDSSGRPVPGAEYWYQSYRGLIALLLATWGPPSIGPVLRQCFLHLWEKEQRGSRSSREYDTHDALLYALGRRGALAALHGITLPPPRWRLAILCLALGYLRAYERFTHLYHEMIVNRTLEQEVTSVLTEQFALSEQECQEVLNAWGEDIWNRRHWSEQEEEDAQENTEESSS